jgi:DNA-binding MarR family transcriptional regulator
MNNMTKRIEPTKRYHYTKIPNEVIRDMTLSNGAFRMYCLIWANSADWIEAQYVLQRTMDITKHTAQKYMQELINKGYVERTKNEKNAWDYVIYKLPKNQNNEKNTP